MRLRLFLLLPLFLGATLTLAAQTNEREREAEEDLDYYDTGNDRLRDDRGDTFGSNVWWGTGAQLGFSSNQFESFFQVGLSPIVGYKINNFLSVGPRGSLSYNRYKQVRGVGVDDFKANFLTWSAGAFARAKVFFPFFVHAEYSLISEVERFAVGSGDPIRFTRAIPFLGGGISQGGGPGAAGFEILILFRLTSADRIGDSPFEFRTGVNFNF